MLFPISVSKSFDVLKYRVRIAIRFSKKKEVVEGMKISRAHSTEKMKPVKGARVSRAHSTE